MERPRLATFCRRFQEKMPLLIVSAGITDVIEETLRSRQLLLDNITIVANTMVFDEGGRLQGFRESPPMHSR